MLLKRLFDSSGPEPQLIGVKLLHAGERQNLSPNFIKRATDEGWLTMDDGHIVLDTDPPVTYRVVRTPGYHCCHCNQPLDGPEAAREHLRWHHPREESPDPENPVGYRVDSFFACLKEN